MWADKFRRAIARRRYLKVPIYVPAEGRGVVEILATSGPAAFVAELERLAALDCAWARAALGYCCLMPNSRGIRDTTRTIQLCEAPARAGSAYAQYILAWAYLLEGKKSSALKMLVRSARASFLPAELDAARFVWQGWGVEKPELRVAERMFRRAELHGHKAARLLRFELYRHSNDFGLRSVVSRLAVPALKLWLVLVGTADPFSDTVFFVDGGMDARVFHEHSGVEERDA